MPNPAPSFLDRDRDIIFEANLRTRSISGFMNRASATVTAMSSFVPSISAAASHGAAGLV